MTRGMKKKHCNQTNYLITIWSNYKCKHVAEPGLSFIRNVQNIICEYRCVTNKLYLPLLIQCWDRTPLFCGENGQEDCSITSPKFNSSPLKNDGWKTPLSFWVKQRPIFRGKLAVKLPGGIYRAQIMAVFVTTNDINMKAPGWPADLSGTGADHSCPRIFGHKVIACKDTN